MRTVPIPNTPLNPSALCLGCGGLGGSLDADTSYQLLDTYLDLGGNFLDTAKVYADWLPGERSSSEKTLGRWMKLRGSRGRVIIATKGAHPELSSMDISRLSPEDIVGDLEASLRNLQTETIDLYWLHRDDPSRPVEEILETLHEQMRAGKIRAYGCSNWSTERLKEAQACANRQGIPGFAGTQVWWNLAKMDPAQIHDPTLTIMDDALWEYHRQTQLAAIPYSSQANGVFQKLESGRESAISPAQRRMYLTPETEQRFQRLQTLRAQTGLTSTQIVLGYLLAQPFPTIPVIGPHSQEQLRDSMSAGEVRLSEEQVNFLIEG